MNPLCVKSIRVVFSGHNDKPVPSPFALGGYIAETYGYMPVMGSDPHL